MATGIGGIPADKLAHASMGFAGQVACEALANKLLDKDTSGLTKSVGCFLLVNGLGAAKELTDKKRGGTPDWNDAAANALGSGLAIPVIKFGF